MWPLLLFLAAKIIIFRKFAFQTCQITLFLFLCNVKQLKQNRYEQNFEGNSSHNADDGFCVGVWQAACGTSKTSSRGGVDGLFSISENKQVYFSQSNLQYQPSSNTWQFARNQYDIIERNDYLQIDENYDGWIDAFAWGTSGNNHGAVCYQPWSNSENDFDFFSYGDSVANLYDHTGQADWGYNRILNGGNQTGQWRTLTKDEWEYIFDKRSTTSGARFAHAVVNGVFGYRPFLPIWGLCTIHPLK